jgi:hypothetical protein
MNKRTLVNTVVTAAVVVVIGPLLALVAAVCTSFGIDIAGGLPVGVFGTMGTTHVVMLVWTLAAVAIVATLVALLVADEYRHA